MSPLLAMRSPPSKHGKAKTNATDRDGFTPSVGGRTGGHRRDPRATLSPRLVLPRPNAPGSTHQQLQDVKPEVQKGSGFPAS